jgi:membrane-associated phospholipid phosphatase
VLRRFLLTLAFDSTLVVLPTEARADEPPPGSTPGSPYRFRLALDLPTLGIGLATASAAFIEPKLPACLPTCEPPSNLNSIDRRVLGNHSPAAHTAADILVATLLVLPHAIHLTATQGKDNAWLEDAAISAEAVVLAQGLTQLTKAAVGRPAPLVYDETVPLDERTSKDALGSFWSGHTATAFAAATSFAVSYWLRRPDDPWKWVVLAALESTALSIGFLKIRAGYHYPTDILAGALAGASTGVLVPMLHRTF